MEFLAGIFATLILWSVLSTIVNRGKETKKIVVYLEERKQHLISLKRERLEPYIKWLDDLKEAVINVDTNSKKISQ